MNTIIIISALLAVAYGKPIDGHVSHTQDTAGNYNLNYETPDASRHEQGFEGGKVVGTFTYQDKEGHHHTVNYLAAPEHGFTAEGGDVPVPVQDTPEVSAARAVHQAVQEKERSILPPLREQLEEQNFAPVQHFAAPPPSFQHHDIIDNTAEIEAAKAEHFGAHHEALTRLADAYKSLA